MAHIIAIDGPSASGKTTLATRLAREHHAIYLHSELDDAERGWPSLYRHAGLIVLDRWWVSTAVYDSRPWTRHALTVLGHTAQAPHNVIAHVVLAPRNTDAARSAHDRQLADKTTTGPLSIARTHADIFNCLLYTSPSPRDRTRSRMPSSA